MAKPRRCLLIAVMDLGFRIIECPRCRKVLGKVETHSGIIHRVDCNDCRITLTYNAEKTLSVNPMRPVFTSSGKRFH